MDRIVKVGIIGCGGIANGKHMPSLKAIPNVEMVAFCDIIEERAVKAAADYGTADAKVYTDYKELLKDESIEVVHVLTPNLEHADITVDALYAGKHVMCEKPMAKTAADAQRMYDAAKATGKKLTIGYQHRQKPQTQFAKEYIDTDALGEIYYANCLAIRRRGTPNWGVFLNEEEQGGGPIIDIATHSLDLTLYLMNNYEPDGALADRHYCGGIDAVGIRLNADGTRKWIKTISGYNDDFIYDVVKTGDGGFVFVGNTTSGNREFADVGNCGENDGFVYFVTRGGNAVSVLSQGGARNDMAMCAAYTTTGGLMAFGQTVSSDGKFAGMNSHITDAFIQLFGTYYTGYTAQYKLTIKNY